jgi:pimeloyl-ACP methyl ester carboxylesterase
MYIELELTERSVLWYCILLGMILTVPIIGSAASPNAEDNLSIFKTSAGEIRYLEAYNATLAQWPVTYESLFIPTRFGPAHVIASGQKDASPLVLLHAATASATQWFPNVKNLSRNFRVYAIDTLGDAGVSKVTRAPQNKSDYALWLSDVFDGLGFQKADLIGSS